MNATVARTVWLVEAIGDYRLLGASCAGAAPSTRLTLALDSIDPSSIALVEVAAARAHLRQLDTEEGGA